MDLSKQPHDKKLQLCRWYYKVGFALLPFVWAVNAVWFFPYAFQREEFSQQKLIRKYVIFSAIGALVWLIGLITWIIIFQTNRIAWGEFADNISFIIPPGE